VRTISVREAKHHFGWLIDDARAKPVVVEKHGRVVVVVMAVEEFERLRAQVGSSRMSLPNPGRRSLGGTSSGTGG